MGQARRAQLGAMREANSSNPARPIHVPQKTANFGNKDRQNRPHGDDFLLGSVSSTVPETAQW